MDISAKEFKDRINEVIDRFNSISDPFGNHGIAPLKKMLENEGYRDPLDGMKVININNLKFTDQVANDRDKFYFIKCSETVHDFLKDLGKLFKMGRHIKLSIESLDTDRRKVDDVFEFIGGDIDRLQFIEDGNALELSGVIDGD